MENETKGLEIRVQRTMECFGVQMVFFERGFDNKIANIGELTMKKCEKEARLPPDSRIELGDTTVQILMDDLWSCGFRPTEGTGSAGSLKATENHLKDMRDIANKSVDLLIDYAKGAKPHEG